MKNKQSDRLNDTIIIQCHALMTDEERMEIHRDLLRQAESGIIVLPACCSLCFVPKDGIKFLKEV